MPYPSSSLLLCTRHVDLQRVQLTAVRCHELVTAEQEREPTVRTTHVQSRPVHGYEATQMGLSRREVGSVEGRHVQHQVRLIQEAA